jgi:uncharacterized protein with HEPN domain
MAGLRLSISDGQRTMPVVLRLRLIVETSGNIGDRCRENGKKMRWTEVIVAFLS